MTNFSPHYIFLCGGNKLSLSRPNYELRMGCRSVDNGRRRDISLSRNFLLGNIIAIIRCGVAAPANGINTVISASVFIGVSLSLHQLARSFFGEIVPKHSLGSAFSPSH